MRFTRLLAIVIALLYLVPFTFAAQPEVGVVYFRPSDRTTPSDIDSKIDTLVKAAQTALFQRNEHRWLRRKNLCV